MEDCQNGAIALGNMIKKIEGEKAATIPMLEEYCNRVYSIYESLTDGNADSTNKIYRILRSSFIQIENSVKPDIKVLLEAVFLLYKASILLFEKSEKIYKEIGICSLFHIGT